MPLVGSGDACDESKEGAPCCPLDHPDALFVVSRWAAQDKAPVRNHGDFGQMQEESHTPLLKVPWTCVG